MDPVQRRAFCTWLAASTGALSGCTLMNSGQSESRQTGDGSEVVTTRSQLEAAFDDLEPGDTIRISDANAPYRTIDWLDIDVDGVTVVGPGVVNLIKPADRANVGGIRVGHNRRCREIDVRGVGYHGNPDGQSDGAERLHGIAVRDAAHVTLERNHIRETHPEKHGDGGSGISVTADCTNVQVLNNRIHEFGDRGIQSACKQFLAYGNTITDGLDRPIACDLWFPDARNRTAQSVTIFGNHLGNTIEGSLVGVARNTPLRSNKGYVSVFGNVGFGTHKSFCHVRGPERIENVSVQNNVSIQETEGLTADNESFAGISIDVAEGHNVSVKNNELYRYSGHGIHVDSNLSDFSLQNNSILRPSHAGIRLVGGSAGVVSGNRITGPGRAGVVVKNGRRLTVEGNYVRQAGTVGIAMAGSESATDNNVTENYVLENSQEDGVSAPGIRIRESGVRVSDNTILQHGAAAITEGDGVRHNVYESNRADGESPWRIPSPTARLQDNIPPVGIHRDVSIDDGSDTVHVEFEKPYARRPWLTFGRVAGGVRDVSYETDSTGDFVGATITLARSGGTIDVRVNDV